MSTSSWLRMAIFSAPTGSSSAAMMSSSRPGPHSSSSPTSMVRVMKQGSVPVAQGMASGSRGAGW